MKRSTITARKPEERPKRQTIDSNGKINGGRNERGQFTNGHRFGFQPGKSGNPGGRPKSHKELESFIQEIFNEAIGVGDHPDWSRLRLMLRGMMTSKSAADHAIVLEHAYGKVAQQVEIYDWRKDAEEHGYDPNRLFQELVEAARSRATADHRSGDAGSVASGAASAVIDQPAADRLVDHNGSHD